MVAGGGHDEDDVATELRARPAMQSMTPEARAALELRNRFLALLIERVNTVRAAARFVFRNEPAIVRQATSAYERRRRAASLRKAKREAPAL